jgi:hypothetical protein
MQISTALPRRACWKFNEMEGRFSMSYVQRRRFLWILFLIGMALVALTARATTLVRLRFQDLVLHSSAIARVRCISAQSRMENGEIWTDIAFDVLEHNKGYLPSVIVVRLPGGKLQHLHSHVEGAPEFRPGEEVYLFLSGHPGKQFLLVGWTQGTFRIRRDMRTGLETVTQDSAEVPVFDPESNRFTKTGGLRRTPERGGFPVRGSQCPGDAVPQFHDGSRMAALAELYGTGRQHVLHRSNPSCALAC